MAAARPVAPTQPHLARLRVDRQHRLIEELRLENGRLAAEIATVQIPRGFLGCRPFSAANKALADAVDLHRDRRPAPGPDSRRERRQRRT